MADEVDADEEVRKKLVEHRQFTEICGTLTLEQETQLKYWPMIISDAITGCEAHFSYHSRELNYEILIDDRNKQKVDAAKKNLPDLEMWSQFLLGDKYLIKVRFNGKTVYRGTRKSNFDPKASENEIEQDFTGYMNKEYKKNKKFIK